VDSSTVGKIALLNPETPSVTEIQREHASIASFVGKALNTSATGIPTFSENYVGASSDSIFARADALTLRFDGDSGHSHSGAPGDGPQLSVNSIQGLWPYFAQIETVVITESIGGSSAFDVTSYFTGKEPSLIGQTPGVVVGDFPSIGNAVRLREDRNIVLTDNDKEIFGLLKYDEDPITEDPEWILEFYTLDDTGDPQPVTTMPGTLDVSLFFTEIFELNKIDRVTPILWPGLFGAGGGGGLSNIGIDVVGSSPNASGATFASGVLQLQPADQTNPGVLTAATGVQQIGGPKEFTGDLSTVGKLKIRAGKAWSYENKAPTGQNAVVSGIDSVIVAVTDDLLESIGGLEQPGSDADDFDYVVLFNETNNPIEIIAEDSSVTAVERIITPDGEDLEVPSQGFVQLFYDRNFTRWRVMAALGADQGGGGLWVEYSFDSDLILSSDDARQRWVWDGAAAATMDEILTVDMPVGGELQVVVRNFGDDPLTIEPTTTGIRKMNGTWIGYNDSIITFTKIQGATGLVEVSRNGF
jgi:hypothetical protein